MISSIQSKKALLEAKKHQYILENPDARTLDIARGIGCSEAELVSLDLGAGVTRLRGEVKDILSALEPVETLMALTRNRAVVHEVHGRYSNGNLRGTMGSFTGSIDLRLHLDHWTQVFFVRMKKGGGELLGLHFYNSAGIAVHKCYCINQNFQQIFLDIEQNFAHDDQESLFESAPSKSNGFGEPKHDGEFSTADTPKFLEDLSKLPHVHHFNALLKKYRLSRYEAMQLMSTQDHTSRLGAVSVAGIFEGIREKSLEIMVFVGNIGAIQIRSGSIRRLKEMGAWYNILETDFNLHVDTTHIAEIWSVFKPTSDGGISSIEFLDAKNRIVLQVFGTRKAGEPENSQWREFVRRLC